MARIIWFSLGLGQNLKWGHVKKPPIFPKYAVDNMHCWYTAEVFIFIHITFYCVEKIGSTSSNSKPIEKNSESGI